MGKSTLSHGNHVDLLNLGDRQWLLSNELRHRTYRVVFMYDGRKHAFALNTSDKQTAEALRGGVEMTLMLLAQGALTIPPSTDVVEYVRSGGKAPAVAPPPPLRFAELRDRYLATHRNGAMKCSSLYTIQIHLKHLGCPGSA